MGLWVLIVFFTYPQNFPNSLTGTVHNFTFIEKGLFYKRSSERKCILFSPYIVQKCGLGPYPYISKKIIIFLSLETTSMSV